MTRINLILPEDLTDQHLMAEYRELPMVLASLRRSLDSKTGFDLERIPKEYTLNSGHVMFFYDKLHWLHGRFFSLIRELRDVRGYAINPNGRSVDWYLNGRAVGLFGDYEPDEKSIRISVERILGRVKERDGWYKLRGQAISHSDYKILIEDKYREAIPRGPCYDHIPSSL